MTYAVYKIVCSTAH